MTIQLTLGDWDTQQEMARAVRYEVFVIEQNIPVELEWDEMDAVCLHALALNASGEAIGTGRLLPDGHIGRMAVRQEGRGAGVGSALLQALMLEAKKRGDTAVRLNAQVAVEPFYVRHGFARQGEEFIEADIPHIHMLHRFA